MSHNPINRDCKLYKAVNSSVGIECDHGYDVCPICDPCTCPPPPDPLPGVLSDLGKRPLVLED